MTAGNLTRPVDAWLVGDWSSGEFQSLRSELAEINQLPHVESFEASSQLLEERDKAPEVLLVALPRPGAIGQSEVDSLIRQSPLTRVVTIAGTWCEGELRTGRPLTGVVRLYWYELCEWWRAAQVALAAGNNPPWSVALDNPLAGREIAQTTKLATPTGCLLIDSIDHAVFAALNTALLSYGWTCHWQPRHRPERWDSTATASCAVAIWDGSQLDPGALENLRVFTKRMSEQEVPVIALLDFPRAEHMELVRKVGVAEAIAKPYQLTGLGQVIERLLTFGS